MVITPFRLFLFVVAAFLAAGGTAYYTGALDAYFAPAPRQVAKQDAQGGAESATTDTSKPAAEAAKAEPASAGGDQAKSADAEAGGGKQAGQVVVPAFDIVRVEPDGSMVVAGHAAPESNVEVVSGSTIVGKAQSGPGGDFAVVLDEPLKPGNHQIVLRSTTPKDVVATSKETAVVSVPDTKNGEVLALVEAPGKPSRLITKPKAKEDGATQEAAAASQGTADKAGAQASGEKAEQAQPHVAMAEPSASAGKDAGTASSSAADAGAMKAGSSEAAGQPAPSAGSEAGAAGSASAEKAETSTANNTAGETPAKPAAGNSVASADAAGKEKVPAGEKKDVKVFIEAVEIDGKDVFVAGGGIPGQRVRVYANDILLGDAIVSPNGRFLVQTTRELPVGDYIVRADLLSDNGAEVIARAAVPFEREPGEKLAAVAPSSRARDEGQPAGDKEPAAGAASSAGKAANEEGSEAATTAPQMASKMPDSDKTEAGSASETEKAAVSETRPASEAAANGAASAGSTEADVATDTGGKASDTAGAAQTASGAANNAAAPAGTTGTGSGAGERMAAADAKGGMQLPDLQNGVAANAPVITAPKLETVDGAVIIRRGDTLWQISRRVYGRGVRYSTIYLANQEQIRDPDMIWPGQVFSVPQETKDGEAADMKAIGEQAVPADMAGTEPEWRR